MKRLTSPRPLPEQEAAAHFAWREGWFNALPIGFVVGFAAALIFLK